MELPFAVLTGAYRFLKPRLFVRVGDDDVDFSCDFRIQLDFGRIGAECLDGVGKIDFPAVYLDPVLGSQLLRDFLCRDGAVYFAVGAGLCPAFPP